MTTGKTIPLARRTFVGKVMSLLFNMQSGLSTLKIRVLPEILQDHLVLSSLQQHLDGFLNSEFYKDSKINKSQTFELTEETMLKGDTKVHIIIYHKQYYVIWCLLLILKCSLMRSW